MTFEPTRPTLGRRRSRRRPASEPAAPPRRGRAAHAEPACPAPAARPRLEPTLRLGPLAQRRPRRRGRPSPSVASPSPSAAAPRRPARRPGTAAAASSQRPGFPTGSFTPGGERPARLPRRVRWRADDQRHGRVGRRRQDHDQDRQRPDDHGHRPTRTRRTTRRRRPAPADVTPGSSVQVQRRPRRRTPSPADRGPAVPPAPRSGRPAASPSSRDRRGRLTAMHLLVIEDDPRLVRLLRRLLEEDRHVVETATTGRDGLDIAEATTGIEVVILDIGLPDISGLEVARRHPRDRVRGRHPDAHRARHGRRPGHRPRRRRGRLPRQAVRLRGAGRPAARARPAAEPAPGGPSRSSSSARSCSTRRRAG